MDQYYRIINGGAGIEAAPAMLYPHLRRPTAGEYAAHAYYRKAPSEPTPPEGQQVAGVRYEHGDDGLVHTLYTYEPIPPAPPRRWSRLSLIRAIKSAGLWDRVQAMLGDYLVELLACDYIAEDDSTFAAILANMRAEFGSATVDALLDALPLEVA